MRPTGPQHRDTDESCTERRALVLPTRPPVGKEGEEVGCADGAVAVEVSGAAFGRSPTDEQREQIGCADTAVGVEVGWMTILPKVCAQAR